MVKLKEEEFYPVQSLKTRLVRLGFNIFPPYFGSGASIQYIASDFHEVRLKLPLSWRTRNIVGTTFGGSMYAAVDPVYMMMLMKMLGPDYIVWDKAACILFKRPGKGTLYARFIIDPGETTAIKTAIETASSVDRIYHVDLVDHEGVVHASVEKTLYVRRKVPSTVMLKTA